MQTLEYKQIADFLNLSTKEVIGEEATIVNEDLSNIVDFGVEVANMGKTVPLLDDFVGRIARVVMYDRVYGIRTDLGIYKDQITFGLGLQRMMVDELPEAEDNPTYELQEGMSVDPFVVKLVKAKAAYYEKRNTSEIDLTVLEKQYRAAFTSPENLSRFTGMIMNAVENSKAIKVNNLQMAILRAAMSAVIHASKAVNLISLYNTAYNLSGGDVMTVAKALYSKDFLKFASMTINDYVTAIKEMSILYNVKGVPRFTPEPRLAMLGKFADACTFYLESNEYHNELVKLPGYSKIDHWQFCPDRTFTNLSKIDVTNDNNDRVQQGGIIGVLYDGDAMGVTVEEPRTNSIYNPKGEYLNIFHKFDWASYYAEDMNVVVFYLADA